MIEEDQAMRLNLPAGRVLRVRIHCLFGDSCILAARQQLFKAYYFD
jgi:hypothetical protein